MFILFIILYIHYYFIIIFIILCFTLGSDQLIAQGLRTLYYYYYPRFRSVDSTRSENIRVVYR